MSSDSPRPVPPGDVARMDQVAAELAEIVGDVRRHMAGCSSVPAGVCLGETVMALALLSCRERFELLQEAVAQLARAEPPPTSRSHQ